MRHRRKQKFTWMPMLGSRFSGEGTGYNANYLRIDGLAPKTDNSEPPDLTAGMLVEPMVPDFTAEQTAQVGEQFTLRDLTEGQDWLMKRVVGKAHLAYNTTAFTPLDQWPAVYVTLGLFVARSIDDAQADVDLEISEADPQAVDNIRQPWAFRRTWLLRNPNNTDPTKGWGTNVPTSTMEYNSVADGPHIDVKVSRRILREQRLWLALSVIGFDQDNIGVNLGNNGAINGCIDLRILGAMRRSRNKSSF